MPHVPSAVWMKSDMGIRQNGHYTFGLMVGNLVGRMLPTSSI